MSVTLDNVTLNMVDYKRLTYDESDVPSFGAEGYPIGFTVTSFQDIPFIQNLSVFGKMLNAGINRMDLYDANAQVIGNIQITNYQEIYVTAQPYQDYGHIDGIEYQYGNNAYLPYLTDGTTRHYTGGVKFKAFSGISSSQKITCTVTLNNETITIDSFDGSGYFIKQIDDVYGSWNINKINSVIFDGPYLAEYIESLGLMTKVENGVTHVYLTETSFIPQGYLSSTGTAEIVATQSSTSILADNLSFTEHPIVEEGFMNEISDRFSPRFNSNGVGLYLIPAENSTTDPSHLGDIEDIMRMMQEYDLGDDLTKSWVGTDGKEYVMGLRWYYGLAKPNVWKSTTDQKFKLQIGPITPTEGLLYYYDYVFTSEFANFSTSELAVPAHFNNYLDFACSYKLYLPYYGFMDIDPNDIVGGTIRVHYNINLFSGAATILVECKNSRTGNLAMKAYTVDCTVGEDIPFTYDMFKSFGVQAAEKGSWAAKTLASGAAGAYGAYAGAVSGTAGLYTDITKMVNNNLIRNEGLSQTMANVYKANGGQGMNANDFHKMFDAALTNDSIETAWVNGNTANRANYNNQMAQTANNIVQQNMPMSVFTPGRSSGSSDETGSMDELFPYLLITRPVNVEPTDYEDYGGIPSSDSVTLNMCNGFTQIRAVHPDTMANAPKYIDEIISQLQAGVYL